MVYSAPFCTRSTPPDLGSESGPPTFACGLCSSHAPSREFGGFRLGGPVVAIMVLPLFSCKTQTLHVWYIYLHGGGWGVNVGAYGIHGVSGKG